MAESEGEFSVVQWFPGDAGYEYVRRNVNDVAAVNAAKHYCTCVGAKVGTTVRVMIEDGGYCVFDWQREQGVVFPEQFAGMYKLGVDRG